MVHDRAPGLAEQLTAHGAIAAASLADLVAHLEAPRSVWLMVPAAAVDATMMVEKPFGRDLVSAQASTARCSRSSPSRRSSASITTSARSRCRTPYFRFSNPLHDAMHGGRARRVDTAGLRGPLKRAGLVSAIAIWSTTRMQTRRGGSGRSLLQCTLAAVGLWLCACGAPHGADGGVVDALDSGVDAGLAGLIGPAGGTISGPGGALLVVPANALAAPVALAITLAGSEAPALDAGLLVSSPIYAITPHGTQFAIPATVILPFDAGSLPGAELPSLYQAELGGAFAPLASTAQDGGTAVLAAVTQLSFFTTGATALRLQALDRGCGRNDDGRVYCWGDLSGLLGEERLAQKPTLMAGGRAFGQFSSGGSVLCGISGTETWCTGDDSSGALGDGSTTSTVGAVKVAAPGGVSFGEVSVGSASACALVQGSLDQGDVYCWGDNLRGQLGNGTSGSLAGSKVPVKISGTAKYAHVVVGGTSACAVRTTGEVDCWGDDAYAQLGHGRDTTQYQLQPTPAQVAGVTFAAGTTSLTAVGHTICGLAPDGSALCWGQNGSGQVGDGTHGSGSTGPLDFKVPSAVTGGHTFASVYGGEESCGLTPAGEAWCWGAVSASLPQQTSPVRVQAAWTFSALSRSCGISKADGRTACWGDNTQGQLGQGTDTPAFAAEPIALPFQ